MKGPCASRPAQGLFCLLCPRTRCPAARSSRPALRARTPSCAWAAATQRPRRSFPLCACPAAPSRASAPQVGPPCAVPVHRWRHPKRGTVCSFAEGGSEVLTRMSGNAGMAATHRAAFPSSQGPGSPPRRGPLPVHHGLSAAQDYHTILNYEVSLTWIPQFTLGPSCCATLCETHLGSLTNVLCTWVPAEAAGGLLFVVSSPVPGLVLSSHWGTAPAAFPIYGHGGAA